jgi:hypothetical protein
MDFAIDKFDKYRFGLVTGSKCSVLFPDKGDGKKGQTTYARTLANEMYFRHYDETSTWQTQHGNLCEHTAFEYYSDYFDSRVEKGTFIQSGECGGTSDALVAGERGIDFKCPTTLNGWLDYLHTPISKEQYHQCQMYMYLWDLPEWIIAAYLEETQFMSSNGLTYPVPHNKRMITVAISRDNEWKDKLQEPLAFVVRSRNEHLAKLKVHFESQTEPTTA